MTGLQSTNSDLYQVTEELKSQQGDTQDLRVFIGPLEAENQYLWAQQEVHPRKVPYQSPTILTNWS